MTGNRTAAAESNRLPTLAETIRTAHGEARKAATATIEHAIAAGIALTEAKNLVPHGEWRAWLAGNVSFSERTASGYMRLARRRHELEISSAADLTIRGAIRMLAPPPADQVTVMIAVRRDAEAWDELWRAPSLQHPGFTYVTHVRTPFDGGLVEVAGLRKPVRQDMVPYVEHALLPYESATFHGVMSAAWTYNLLLFATPEQFVDSLILPDDRAEIVDLIETRVPDEDGVALATAQAKPVMRDGRSLPLCAIVFPDEFGGLVA
jgi:hypothetical protein